MIYILLGYAITAAMIVMWIDYKNGIRYSPNDFALTLLSAWILIPYAAIMSLFEE